MAFNILQNPEDAEECVNDAYISLWKTIPPNVPENLKAYVCKVTRNLSISRLKYNKAEKRKGELAVSFSDLEDTPARDDFAPLPEEKRLGKLISDFLRLQKHEQREVFIRRYWFMDSVKKIAEDCSLSESKVYSMLFRTRNKLKKYLKKEGIDI